MAAPATNKFMSRAGPVAQVAGAAAFAAVSAGACYAAESRAAVSDARATRLALGFAGLAGAVGVGSGAFGFHGLRRMLSARGRTDLERWQKIWEIGVQYSLVTSAAIAAVAALPESTPRKRTALGALTAGVPMFSWSIQAYVLSGASAFQYLTPFGGLAMMGGWSALAVGALLEPPADEDGYGDGGENAEESARLPR
eukprot:PRCOL_00002822-RA